MKNISDNALLKELQKRLKIKEEIETELFYQKKELLEINQKLENSEKFKSHFISNLTNELVNPITSLLGFAKFLQHTEVDDSEKISKFSKLIYKNAFEINFHLQNVFTAAEFESGEYVINKTNFKIKNLFDDAIDEMEYLWKQKNIEIKIEFSEDDFPKNIETDVRKLKIVITNILNNSIRYSNENNKILIKIKFEDDKLKISIRDFGIGISPDLTEKVFERFYRIDNSINSINKGSGLGLSVSKQIIEKLGGNIEFQDHKNGVEVVFCIAVKSKKELKEFSTEEGELFLDDGIELF